MKKLTVICVSLLICLSFGIGVLAQDAGEVVVIYTNDTHCEVEGALGFADISAIQAIEESKGNDVFILDAGDAIQGGAIGAISKGEYIIDIMNEIGYDVAILGNHEFDYTVERLMELSEKAEFPYISANFVSLADHKPVFAPYHIVSAGDIDIALIGAITPHTFTSTAPKYFQNDAGEFLYDFCGENIFEVMQSYIDEVKERADVVVAVTHFGVDMADAPYTSVSLIENTTGLDVVIDAHSHMVIPPEVHTDKGGDAVILSSTGAKFANIGVMRVTPDAKVSLELLDETYKADGLTETAQNAYDKTNAFVDAVKAKYSTALEQVVATSEYDLTVNHPDKIDEVYGAYRQVRRGETNMGNFCADAYRFVCDTDIGLINGGGVRANIAKGDVTYGDILNVNPFGNTICIIQVTGEQILQALEHGTKSYPSEDGAFLQVSGLTYEIDESVESPVVLDDKGVFAGISGENRVKNVKVGGEVLDQNKTYTLASSTYTLLDCGDGFSMFTESKVVNNSVCSDVEALIKYVDECLDGVIGKGYENALGEGRIQPYAAEGEAIFADIQDHWAKDYIQKAASKNLVNGMDENTFAPEMPITRGMLVTMLYRLEGEPEAADGQFADVADDAYFAEAVAWASAKDIVYGVSETAFVPEANITREQMAAMLYRYAVYKNTDVTVGENTNILSYDDFASISEYAIPAMQYTTGAGLIKGRTESTLNPTEHATRAETAVIFVRFLEVLGK